MSDEVKGWLRDVSTGEYYYVSTSQKSKVQKHPIPNGPNPDGSGWEGVTLSAPRSDGHRNIRFNEANVNLAEDGTGDLVTRPPDADGAFETFWIVEQPPGWDTTLAFRRHELGAWGADRQIQNVFVFERKR